AVFMRDETYVGLGTADFPANQAASRAIGNTGDHRFNGVLMMQGRGIVAGDLGEVSLMDVAPTALHLLGQPIPADMDGKVLQQALSPELQNVVIRQAESAENSGPETAYSDDEEREILQHLQDLGYLG